MQEKIIEKTQSICPACKKIIDAKIIEENGSAYMVKECLEHGLFKAIISKYAWYYRGLNSLYDILFPSGHTVSDRTIRAVRFYLTSKCNLNCPICYAHTKEATFEKSLDEIKKIARSIKGRKTVSLLGGEPTLREDIFQIIEAFSKTGHFVEFFTNGIKLKEMNYSRRLKRSGIGLLQIGLDTLSDDAVYEEMRGRRLLEDKRAALSNLEKLKIKTGIIDVILRDRTEKYIPEIIDFSRRNKFIYKVCVRGYSHMGRLGFSVKEEFTIDELVEIFEKETKALVTLEEFYIFQKIGYILRYILYNVSQCYVNQHIFIPRNGKKMRDIFHLDKFRKNISLFEDMLSDQPVRAKTFFLKSVFSCLVTQSPSLLIQKVLQNKIAFFDSRYYLPLEFAMFYTPYSLDLNKIRKRCADAWLPSYIAGRFDSYCGMLCQTTPIDNLCAYRSPRKY